MGRNKVWSYIIVDLPAKHIGSHHDIDRWRPLQLLPRHTWVHLENQPQFKKISPVLGTEREGGNEREKVSSLCNFFCTLWVHFVHFYKQSLKIIHIFDTFKFSCKLHRNRPLYPACPLPPNRKLWLGNHVTWPGGQMEATTHTLWPQNCSVRLWWKLTNLVFYLKNVDEANNEEVLKNMT